MDSQQTPTPQIPSARLTHAMANITAWRIRHPGVGYDKEPEEIWLIRRDAMQQLSALSEGDTDPWLNRRIKVIIRKSTRFIVYLDDQWDVQWWWLQRPKDALTVALIQARATNLAHESRFLLHDNDLRSSLLQRLGRRRAEDNREVEKVESIRAQIGEAMALAIEGASLLLTSR